MSQGMLAIVIILSAAIIANSVSGILNTSLDKERYSELQARIRALEGCPAILSTCPVPEVAP